MRSYLERKLHETWYGDRAPGGLLMFLEKIYAKLSGLHRAINRRRQPADLQRKPIFVVGNLTAGGGGKTPMVVYLCKLAIDCGFRPGVVSRGYGRSGSQPQRVTADSDPAEVGDEPLLIAQRCAVPVQVDNDRERAARTLFEDGVDLVISDDGLQRMRLPRKLEICVVDRISGFGNGRLLPAGPLRETPARLQTVDFAVDHLPAGTNMTLEKGFNMSLKAGRLHKLHGEESMDVTTLAKEGQVIHAVAGIAQPERFFISLDKMGLEVQQHVFADHHRYRKSDFARLGGDSMVIMTEKDAVKCRKLPLFNAWYLPVEAVMSENLEAGLREKMGLLVRKRKI
jgi:tetraacyldisaccharide 4'-kinase